MLGLVLTPHWRAAGAPNRAGIDALNSDPSKGELNLLHIADVRFPP